MTKTLCVLQHVETMAALVETVEGDEQNMDSGEAEGRSLKGCKVSSFRDMSPFGCFLSLPMSTTLVSNLMFNEILDHRKLPNKAN
jgi:hypothetical protein